MGTIIQFPRLASVPTAIPGMEANTAELLQMKLSDKLLWDEDTGELIREGANFDQLSRFFRLFGLSLVGLTQAYEVVALYRGLAKYNIQAKLILSNPSLFEQSTGLNDDGSHLYVRAIVRGDLAATKQYADSIQLRKVLLQA